MPVLAEDEGGTLPDSLIPAVGMDIIRFVDRISPVPLNPNTDFEEEPASVGGSNPDFETGSVTPWFANSGTVTVTQEATRLGSYVGKLVANGSANPRAIHSNSESFATAGQDYTINGWIMAPTGLTGRIALQWYTASGATFLSQSNIDVTLVAGTWTYVEETFTAPATTDRCARMFGISGTPASGTVIYGDHIHIRPAEPPGWVVGSTPEVNDCRLYRTTLVKHEGTASAVLIPDGVVAEAYCAMADRVPVVAGEVYTGTAWCMLNQASPVFIMIAWYNAAGLFITGSNTLHFTPNANVWQQIRVDATPPAGAATAQLRIIATGDDLPASLRVYIDEAELSRNGGGGAPNVRLDLNDGNTWGVTYEGTDFSPPPLKSSWANTLLTDGERLSAAAYGNRTIQLSMDLMASTQDGIARELQKLWRELNRPANILEYKPNGATEPVYFRTFRSSNTRVTDFPSGAMRTVDVSIEAEPFAYGLKEQEPNVTITNDPFANSGGVGGMKFDVPRATLGGGTENIVKGDVETPLFIRFDTNDIVQTPTVGPWLSVLSTRRRGNPEATPFYLDATQFDLFGLTTNFDRHSAFSRHLGPVNSNTSFEATVSPWVGTLGTVTRDTTVFSEATASLRFNPTNGSLNPSVASEKFPVTALEWYVINTQMRCAVVRSVSLGINWYDAGGALLSTSSLANTITAANVFQSGRAQGQAPATATQASIFATLTGTVPSTDVLWLDDAQVGRATHVTVDMAGLSDWTTVLTSNSFPRETSIDARGTYRVFMRYRYRQNGQNWNIDARLRWGRADAMITNPTAVLSHNDIVIRYADLGLIQLPAGYDPVHDGPSGNEVPPSGVRLEVDVIDGDAVFDDLDIDHLLFFPADDRFLLIQWPTTSGTKPGNMVLDSEANQVYARNTITGHIDTLPGVELGGAPPMITPGLKNRVFMALDVGKAANTTTVRTAVCDIAPYYWPRYLTVRPPTT